MKTAGIIPDPNDDPLDDIARFPDAIHGRDLDLDLAIDAREAFKAIQPRERRVIWAIHKQGKTISQISKSFSLSKCRLRSIEQMGILRIQGLLSRWENLDSEYLKESKSESLSIFFSGVMIMGTSLFALLDLWRMRSQHREKKGKRMKTIIALLTLGLGLGCFAADAPYINVTNIEFGINWGHLYRLVEPIHHTNTPIAWEDPRQLSVYPLDAAITNVVIEGEGWTGIRAGFVQFATNTTERVTQYAHWEQLPCPDNIPGSGLSCAAFHARGVDPIAKEVTTEVLKLRILNIRWGEQQHTITNSESISKETRHWAKETAWVDKGVPVPPHNSGVLDNK